MNPENTDWLIKLVVKSPSILLFFLCFKETKKKSSKINKLATVLTQNFYLILNTKNCTNVNIFIYLLYLWDIDRKTETIKEYFLNKIC